MLTQLSLPTPPQFTSITPRADGGQRLKGLGLTDLSYTVLANTNLDTTNWTSLGTATADGAGIIAFDDLDAPNFSQRFYRLCLP